MSRHRLWPWIEAAYPFSNVGRSVCRSWSIPWSRGTFCTRQTESCRSPARLRSCTAARILRAVRVFTAPPGDAGPARQRRDRAPSRPRSWPCHELQPGAAVFRLGGRAWEVGRATGRKAASCEAADRGRVPTWIGLPGSLSTRICQTMLDVLLHEQEEVAWLTRNLRPLELASLRGSYSGVLEQGRAPLEEQPDGVVWHTFAGGAVNRLLSAGLEQKFGQEMGRRKFVPAMQRAFRRRRTRGRGSPHRARLGAGRGHRRTRHGPGNGSAVKLPRIWGLTTGPRTLRTAKPRAQRGRRDEGRSG